MATGFEALVGYLYLIGDNERLNSYLILHYQLINNKSKGEYIMTKRENPRRKEREFNKFQEKSNRVLEKKMKIKVSKESQEY